MAIAKCRYDEPGDAQVGERDRGQDRKGNNGAGHLSKGVEAGRETGSSQGHTMEAKSK